MRYMGREMTPKESSDIECIGSLGESGNCCFCYFFYHFLEKLIGDIPQQDLSMEIVRLI